MNARDRGSAHRSPGIEQLEPRLLLSAAIIKGPYLQQTTPDSMVIMWETDVAADSRVDYGGQYVEDAALVTIHEMQLTALSPDTTYTYTVTSDGTTSPQSTFAAAPAAERSFRFAAYGDTRSQPAEHAAVVQGMINTPGGAPELVLHTGDLVGNGDNYAEWGDQFFAPTHGLMIDTPLLPVIGNHEGSGSLFLDFFSLPNNEEWFAYTYSNVRFIGLNTHNASYSAGSDQYDWLVSELQSSQYAGADWQIVYFHHPPYTATSSHSDEIAVQQHLVPLFEQHGVDMVFNGHSHLYERYFHNGIYYIVTGGGGAPLATLVEDTQEPIRQVGVQDYHHCIVDVDVPGKALTLSARYNDGTQFDTISLYEPVDVTPPTASLIEPLDGGADDLDPDEGEVTVNTTQPNFQIQLSDVGDGIDDTTVTSPTVALTKDGVPLAEPGDYSFSYDAAADVITLAPTGDEFGNGSYGITLSGAAQIADQAGNEMAATTITVTIDTSIVLPQTVTFQQGVGGYGGMVDTMLRSAEADRNFADSAVEYYGGYQYQYNADTDSDGGPCQILLRFDDIIGAAAGRIAPGSTVQSATLRLRSTDDGNGGNLHPLLQPWVDTAVTWNNSFGGNGVQADNTEAASAADAGLAQNNPDTDADFDVAARLQAWVDGEANNGWAILPNGTNGWHMAAAEHPTLDYRPELIVTFYAGPDATPPTARLLAPLDNGPDDFDPTDGAVTVNTTQADFQIQLDDAGDGVDDATVTGETVAVSRDGTPLVEGTDYSFGYDAVGDGITLTPIGGDFGDGAYEIVLSGGAAKIADLAGNAMAATTLTVVVDTSIVVPQTLTFQQGAGGYAGTADTNLLESYPDAEYAAAASFTVDTDEPPGSGKAAQVLMRFENIFGGGPDQIPPGAQIVSAGLQLQVLDGGNSFNLHRMLQDWADTDTWNALGAGIQADDTEAAATPEASTGPVSPGPLPMDVTASLTAWAASPAANYGWAMLPTGTDGVDFHSAEGTTPPALSVTFLPPGPNDPPVAADDTAGTDEDTPVVIPVLANDSDPNEDLLSVVSVTQGGNGSVAINPDETLTYTPDADFNGTDSFTYTASDGRGGTDTATVNVTVTAVNDAPVADGQSVTTDQGAAVGITLTGEDGDPEVVQTLTFALDSYPSHGTLTDFNPGTGEVTYTPEAAYSGPDSFTFTVTDDAAAGEPASLTSAPATVDITVTPGEQVFYATGESTAAGTVAGSHLDTRDSNNVYEALTEVVERKKSILEHTWTFNLTGGETITFSVEAYHSLSVEDDFAFQYSTDGALWTDMVTVTKTSDDGAAQTYDLPGGLTGTLYVRAIDTNRAGNKTDLDTLYVDEMHIASVGGGPQLPTVSVEATDADAAEAGADSGTFTITRSDTSGDLTVYYSVSGTAINGTDYTQLSGAGVIPEGDYSVDVEVAPLDDGLEEGSETVILTISADAAYNVGSPDSGTVTLLDDDAVVVHNYAAGEETALGTVAGTYLDTHASDDVYEAITEQLRGKKSVLEHTWTFNVSGGNTATFHVEAWHEGTEDDFLFQYSTDGATWTDMVTVTKTGDDGTAQTYDFAGALSGTVYVRVIDTDRSPGNTALDTLSIDEMFIRCQ